MDGTKRYLGKNVKNDPFSLCLFPLAYGYLLFEAGTIIIHSFHSPVSFLLFLQKELSIPYVIGCDLYLPVSQI